MDEYIKELDTLFKELKFVSSTTKLNGTTKNSGDIKDNKLEKQFLKIITNIEEKIESTPKEDENYVNLICFKASILYEKAKIYLAENLLEESKECLENAINLVSNHIENTKISFIFIRLTNHLSYVLSRLGNLTKAKELLEKIVQTGKISPQPEIYSTEDLFTPDKSKVDSKILSKKYDKLIINNMQMLSWVYTKLNLADQHLQIQHEILQKQFEFDDGDAIQWAQSCFRLAGLYLSRHNFEAAKYHICAAETVLSPLEMSLVQNQELFKTQADIARCWIYYGLKLFEISSKEKQIILESGEDNVNWDDPNENVDGSSTDFEFEGLDVKVSNNVPSKILKTVQDAMSLFVHIQKYVKRSRIYYTLRDSPLQYINTCLDQSELFRYLASYHSEYDSQYNIQRKRYEALENLCLILKEVRPQYYVAMYIELMRELIEVQAELMNINLLRMYKQPTQGAESGVLSEESLRKKMSASSNIHIKLGCLQDTIEFVGSSGNKN